MSRFQHPLQTTGNEANITHDANDAPRLNLMKHNETVLLYALLDIFFSFMQ